MMGSSDDQVYDAALGCLLGACVGDAAGATLEFLGRKPTHVEVAHALTMPGGGFFKLAPGQITDDGELTLSLARALSSSKSFSIERIARSYADWIRSGPFDIGGTISASLGSFLDPEWVAVCNREGFAVGMARAASFSCMDSKANGSLMRATPLGIWGNRLRPNDLARIAREDSSLSHPNASCVNAVACYVIAIASLVKKPGERQLAFERAKDWADLNANDQVCEWLSDAAGNRNVPYHPQVGFIKIAFTHAFRHLLLGTDYVAALEKTLAGGGDTDTNACIVGGLIGAACGANFIPDPMKDAVLLCDTTRGLRPRPKELQTNQIPDLVRDLLSNAP